MGGPNPAAAQRERYRAKKVAHQCLRCTARLTADDGNFCPECTAYVAKARRAPQAKQRARLACRRWRARKRLVGAVNQSA